MERDTPASGLQTCFQIFYDELSRMAHQKLRFERVNHTLDTSALVHEVFFHLNKQQNKPFLNQPQFLAIASITMRRILVNYARGHKSQKRNAGKISLTYGESLQSIETTPDEILALHEALKILKGHNPRQATVVEYNFFGGFTHQEIAEALRVSVETVRRDWRVARAWLSLYVRSQT